MSKQPTKAIPKQPEPVKMPEQPKQPQLPFLPLGFVLKFDPPVIGLLYKPIEAKKSDKKKMYTIHLNNLIFLAEPEDIVEALFTEHPNFLDPNIIKPEQIFKLVLRLVAYRDHQMQGMGAFMTDGMGQLQIKSNLIGEEYYEGDEEEEYTEEELLEIQQHQMMQQELMKQQLMKQQGGGGKGNAQAKKARAYEEEVNRSF